VLILGDLGLWGPPRLRMAAYEYAAFWPGLLDGWSPNYPLQPWTMFASYAFLHGGLLHLGMNMVTLVSLGRAVIARIGPWRFGILYAVTAVVGAGVYALLSTSGAPMVGASGALFGLAGALLAWLWEDQPSLRAALRVAGRVILLLVALNVVLFVALQGRLAWETHLGGFLAGWVAGLALDLWGGGR
jgi:membrane associated rhomboid family serine protease